MTSPTQRLTRHFCGLLLALLTLAPLQAQTPPALALDREVAEVPLDAAMGLLLDAGGQRTVDDMEQSAPRFAPVQRGERHLLGDGALWLRFDATVRNPNVHWRLTVPLPGVDDVRLYFRDAAGRWVTQQAGDRHAVSSWTQPARYPVFSLSPEIGKPVRYYVEIRHARVPYSALPRVVSDTQLINTSLAEHLLLGIYFGLAALVVTLALANALAYRDAGFGTYALYIAVFSASQASFTGVAGLYWWPHSAELNRATIFLLPAAAASAMWFVRTVTLPRRFARVLDFAMLALMLLLPVGGAVDAFWPSPLGYTVMNSLISVSLVLLLAVVGVALAAGDRHTRWVAAGFMPVLLATAFPLLRNLNVIASSFLSDYALLFGSAIEVPILFYGLHRRVSQRRDLSARASGLSHNDPLTGLDSALVFSAKLQHVLATAERTQQSFALLLIHLSNQASLHRQHGRDTADRALVMAAARLRAVANSADTVARVGETQFALLVEGPIGTDAANGLATKILASGLRPSDQLPGAEPLLFHIAVGHHPGTGKTPPSEAQACLARMLREVKALDDGAGKAIRRVTL